MAHRKGLLVSLLLVSSLVVFAKNKQKVILPTYVLQARTVFVMVDPAAGVQIEDPNANRVARDNVEKALTKWGRFTIALDSDVADLVVVVRKGNRQVVHPTIGGVPINDSPVVMQPSDSGSRTSVGVGHQSMPWDASNSQYPTGGPTPQTEVGPTDDTFAIYPGGPESSIDVASAWRYSAKNALNSPGVPAVEEFRKAIAEAEKQQQSHP